MCGYSSVRHCLRITLFASIYHIWVGYYDKEVERNKINAQSTNCMLQIRSMFLAFPESYEKIIRLSFVKLGEQDALDPPTALLALISLFTTKYDKKIF